MESSLSFLLTGPQVLQQALPGGSGLLTAFCRGPSASAGRRGEAQGLAIINPRRSDGKTSLLNPARPAWGRLLSGHCVWLTGVCGNRGCRKYPIASDTSSDSRVFIPEGDGSFGHTHAAPCLTALSGVSKPPCCLHADADRKVPVLSGTPGTTVMGNLTELIQRQL